MLSYLQDLVTNYYINYNNFKNVLEFIPNHKQKIKEQKFEHNELIKKIAQFCKNEENKKFIISLSGGVDSMVLISIILNLGYEVIGAHINYNNRDETKDEEKFLTQWCTYNNIKLYVKNIDNIKRANSKRCDYEVITKNIRLDFYKELMLKEKSDIVLLAHHKDDIVENIFANVCRGRYILDLAVIKEKSIINNINIGRPMIDFYKTAIYEFSEKYQVPYFKDTTPDWSVRGKYRNKIYPIIQDAFSENVKSNLIGLSVQSYEWNELITKEIMAPFMKEVKFNFEKNSNFVEFDIINYKNHPLCFWNVVFMNIFNKYGYSCPSRKGIQTFMNNIIKESPHNTNISVSNSCVCSVKKNIVNIRFK